MSRKNKIDINNVDRYEVSPKKGLSDYQIDARKEEKLTNATKVKVGKSYLEIIFTDLFTFFNILLFAIAGFMIAFKYYDGLFFLFVLIPNIVITMYEDINARRLLGKLNLLNQSTSTVVRNGKKVVVISDDIVLDDIVYISGSNQINADGTILEGDLLVDESLLTGESKPVRKQVGDTVYAGSYSVSGESYVRVQKIGKFNYIEQVHQKANNFKRTHSEIKSSLKNLFWVVGSVVVVVGIATFVVYFIQNRFNQPELMDRLRISVFGSLVAMIPSGMYLLTSAVFALSVINLAQKKAQIQDFYSVEMLSKVDTLCVDKTGTITDGHLTLDEIKIVDYRYTEDDIKKILFSILAATKDNNETSKAILRKVEKFDFLKPDKILRFNSINKYSAASFDKQTFALGALECIRVVNDDRIQKLVNDRSSIGLRVLVLARGSQPISNDVIHGQFEAIALVILEDHIKEDAAATFGWFEKNNVEIKVISGDDAQAVSYIASKAGITNSEIYTSLADKSIEEVKQMANKYTIFGRVTPEQKEALVTSLREQGKTVAMTGDGVNDILALKRSDCSIAMANGSDAARNVANIVLLDSNFQSLPTIVGEGRRIVNNLQRTCSLFLVKTCFAVFFSIFFLILSLANNDNTIFYPFRTNHLYLWEIWGIGISAFFISLEKNETEFKGGFIKNILKKALPGGICIIIGMLLIYLMGLLQLNNVMNFGIVGLGENIINNNTIVAMSSIFFSIMSLVILYDICKPFSKYRGIVFGICSAITLGCGIAAYFVTKAQGTSANTIIRIPFESMTTVSWFLTAVIILFTAFLFLLISYIISVLGKENNNENRT